MAQKEPRDKQSIKNQRESIKSQRVKSFFIQAAKEIIINEGVENVSVRKVADHAGYTFTTIYNYFKDLNELLQEAKNVMIQDVMIYMRGAVPEKLYDLEDIKDLNHRYVSYYIERPNIFRFFYSYRLQPVTGNPKEALDYGSLYHDTYRGFVKRGLLTDEEVPLVAKTIIYTIHGLLALYFSDNGLTIDRFFEELDKITEYLLKGSREK